MGTAKAEEASTLINKTGTLIEPNENPTFTDAGPEKKTLFSTINTNIWVPVKGFLFATGKMTVVSVIIILAAAYFILGATGMKAKALAFKDSFLSSSTQAYEVEISGVNTWYTKSMWIMGASQVAFKNADINGTLDETGALNFNLHKVNGPTADVSATVGIRPEYQAGKPGHYEFTGQGIHGGFTVGAGKAPASDFTMSINMNLISKK